VVWGICAVAVAVTATDAVPTGARRATGLALLRGTGRALRRPLCGRHRRRLAQRRRLPRQDGRPHPDVASPLVRLRPKRPPARLLRRPDTVDTAPHSPAQGLHRLLGIRLLSLSLSLSLSLFFLTAIFPGEPGLNGFIGAKNNGSGGDNWSYKSCKAPVKSSPPTNQHPTFCRPDALPVAEPTVSKH